MRHVLIAVLLAVGITLVAPRALAKDQEVQVLDMASPDAWQNAKALTGAIRRAVLRAEGWTLAPGEYSLEVLSVALDCPEPPDDQCLQKVAKKVKSERIIWGEVKKTSPKEVTARVRLWQGGQTQKESTFTYSKNLTDDTDDALLALAETALNELIGPDQATLVISAGNIDGEVLVNGVPFGAVTGGEATLEVPTGELNVEVKAAGYERLSETVEVAAGETATLNLDPVRLPEGAVFEEPEVDSEPEPERPTSSNTTWGIATLGLGGAGLATGTVFWIISYNQATDPEFEDYVNDTPRDQDPCVRARDEGAHNITDICDSNVTSRYLAYTMFGLGAVLTGVGAYLLLSSEDGSEMQANGVRFQPRIGLGPNAGRLDLQLSF